MIYKNLDKQGKGMRAENTQLDKKILRVIATISTSPGLYHKALLSFLTRKPTLQNDELKTNRRGFGE